MEQILMLFKNYFGIAFLLLIISYLTPKETYRKYFQFFISLVIAVMLFQPLMEWVCSGNRKRDFADWEELEKKFASIEFEQGMEEDIFECFGSKKAAGQVEETETR